jgi:hypothetical protein
MVVATSKKANFSGLFKRIIHRLLNFLNSLQKYQDLPAFMQQSLAQNVKRQSPHKERYTGNISASNDTVKTE